MGASKQPGPWGAAAEPSIVDLGTLCLAASPLPGVIGLAVATGMVRVLGLQSVRALRPAARSAAGAHLGDADFSAGAAALGSGVQAALLRAFAEVESGGRSGFGPDGRPVIAFEGHVFRRYTHRRYDRTHPLLSYPYVRKAGPQWRRNNRDQAHAWAILEQALALNHEAALKACSWGMFQVMGFNHAACGYATVDAFVDTMKVGEAGQLQAFVGYCRHRPGMVAAMRALDFAQMAELYNGEDFGDYDRRIERAYRHHAAH